VRLRSILAVVAGYLAWVAGFWVPAIALASVWPELAPLAFEDGRYDVFETPMLMSFQLIWVLANSAAGFVTRLVAKSRIEVWVAAALLFAYFAYNHFWVVWNVMPDWYNVLVVVLAVPGVLIGSRVAEAIGARRGSSQTTTA
jgi:Ca2+/H+ antiporter